jgi:hypothetical protein
VGLVTVTDLAAACGRTFTTEQVNAASPLLDDLHAELAAFLDRSLQTEVIAGETQWLEGLGGLADPVLGVGVGKLTVLRGPIIVVDSLMVNNQTIDLSFYASSVNAPPPMFNVKPWGIDGIPTPAKCVIAYHAGLDGWPEAQAAARAVIRRAGVRLMAAILADSPGLVLAQYEGTRYQFVSAKDSPHGQFLPDEIAPVQRYRNKAALLG